VNARNVCQLLNAIAPSSVAEFKDAGLEYVCLSLEAVLQNGYVMSTPPEVVSNIKSIDRWTNLIRIFYLSSIKSYETISLCTYHLLGVGERKLFFWRSTRSLQRK